jgi:hypothetical protein
MKKLAMHPEQQRPSCFSDDGAFFVITKIP